MASLHVGQLIWPYINIWRLRLMKWARVFALLALATTVPNARADVGDPQVRTEHLWYPGELAMSTFERLQATQAECYRRVTGINPKTDQDKALASWFWRN